MKKYLWIWLAAVLSSSDLCRAEVAKRPPISIAITTDAAVVKAGSSVWIKVHLKNVSKHTVDASSSINDMIGVDPSYHFDVRDAFGGLAQKKIFEHLELATGHSISRSLKPGETIVDEEEVSRIHDMSRAGTYVIQVTRDISAKPKDGVVRSNKIMVTITE